MKAIYKTSFRALCITAIFSLLSFHPRPAVKYAEVPPPAQTIMLALLLDTSNSMDGLIDQAKSQLWRIVNQLSTAKCADGNAPRIKIALYEYGNDRLSMAEGYIRMVSPSTDDLDMISETLFGLTTNGGSEFCGHVIRTSLRELDWSNSKADLKLIFIAGNEPFNQGEVPYAAACGLAKDKDVIINTIFCGNYEEGIHTYWKDGATLTGGTYMSIDQDKKTIYIPTPYDEQIDALNDQLNKTYIYYGHQGESKKELQYNQDKNAEAYGRSNKVERAISKSSNAYSNSSWDLVDAVKQNEKVLYEVRDEELPNEMRGFNVEQRKSYVKQKSSDRARIQNEIQLLSRKRQDYLAAKDTAKSEKGTLDLAIMKAIEAQARTKNLKM